MHRICGFNWSDNDDKPGSNHLCGEEHGHVGNHDCLTCHAIHPAADELPLEQAVQAACKNR